MSGHFVYVTWLRGCNTHFKDNKTKSQNLKITKLNLPQMVRGTCIQALDGLAQRSPTFLAPGTGFVEDNFSTDQGWGWGDGFGMIQAHYIYCALYFYCYSVVIYNEIIMQLTIMQNQWEPWAFGCYSLIGFWYESASNWFIVVSVRSDLSANDNLYLQPLPSASITASAPPQIIRH